MSGCFLISHSVSHQFERGVCVAHDEDGHPPRRTSREVADELTREQDLVKLAALARDRNCMLSRSTFRARPAYPLAPNFHSDKGHCNF